MRNTDGLFINGKWCAGEGQKIASVNPATSTEIWSGHAASPEQVASAISAARKSLEHWRSLSLDQRCEYINKFTQSVTQQQLEFAELLAQETGKPLWEAKTEITAMIGKFEISKQAFADRCKEYSKDMPGYTSVTRHKPHGVVVVLGPFNFPAHLPNGHIIPALLAGNTVVFKPSELTPSIARKTISCWQASGIPDGVINLILGHGDIGQLLTQSPEINGVFFTGSYATGHKIAQASLEFPNRIVALEMGGNNPLIVHKPESIAAAVYTTIQSAFTTTGQRCTCARRLIVINDAQGQEFVKQLCHAVSKIKIGSYTEQPEPFMGPLINKAAADKVLIAYNNLIAAGAIPLVAMQRLKPESAFVTPCILDVTNMPKSSDEEVFGPLLRLHWVQDFASAINEANNTSYGLSAGLISTDVTCYQEFMQKVNAGIVNWNRPTIGSSSAAPFGGIGKSGNHRPSAYYAADYCSYPVASMESASLELPEALNPGITL